jgi:hypothetical protein
VNLEKKDVIWVNQNSPVECEKRLEQLVVQKATTKKAPLPLALNPLAHSVSEFRDSNPSSIG